MNETTNSRIANILVQRRPLADKIKNLLKSLDSISCVLSKIDQNRMELIGKVNENRYPKLAEVDFSSLHPLIVEVKKDYAKLHARFSRETLNIGVVGRARQGKSRLLQSLTGLSAAEIPDGNRQHCTGVRSMIFHHHSADAWGEVYFYSEEAFMQEVILPYYIRLNLGIPPVTFDQFMNSPLPEAPGGAEHGAQFEHLRLYHERAPHYGKLLQQASPLRIERQRIPEFVAQHDVNNPDQRYDNYLAVREVRIYCQFPNTEIEKIALIDMPGLGDTGIGDEDRLIKSLGEDVDLILFARMPKSSGDHWADVDVQLYDTAFKALPEINLDKWSFMVINRLADGTNSKNCSDLLNTIKRHHINTAETFIANASDPREANQYILQPILDFIGREIGNIDKDYVNSKQGSLHKLRQQIREKLDTARAALADVAGQSEELRVFEPLFDNFWFELTNGFKKLLEELEKVRQDDDPNFKKALELSLQNAHQDSGIPSLGEAERMSRAKGGVDDAFGHYLRSIRTRLTRHFYELDQGLKISVSETKNKIADVLVSSGLEPLATKNGGDLLITLLEKIKADGGLPTLQEGFAGLIDFQLLYRGMIQHRIRQHLDDLVGDKTTFRLPGSPKVEDMMERLQAAHAEVLYRIEAPLRDIMWEPSMANFAFVEEFIDRVLWAGEAQREWKYFLNHYKGEIWQDEFNWYALLSKAEKELLQLTIESL